MPEARARVEFLRSQDGPIYANATLVNFFNGDFILEFAFVDPLSIGEAYQTANATDDPGEIVQIQGQIVARLAISKQVAERLAKELQEELLKAKEQKDE